MGFLGGLACAPEVNNINDHPTDFSTIFDCTPYTDNAEDRGFFYFSKVIQLAILFQNFSVLPIIFFLTRKEAISLLNKPHLNKGFFKFFTALFIVSATLVGVLAIDVSIILSLDGAIFGFFIVYGIPVYIHLKCYHHKFTQKENKIRSSLLSSGLEDELQDAELDDEMMEDLLKCNKHKKKSKGKHIVLYGFIVAIGLALGVFKIYSLVE